MTNEKRQGPGSYFRFSFLCCFRISDYLLIPWRTDTGNVWFQQQLISILHCKDVPVFLLVQNGADLFH